MEQAIQRPPGENRWPKGEWDGTRMHELMTELFPIHRHLMGDGIRETLCILKDHIPLKIHEVPSGTKAFDWEVPLEWHVRDWGIAKLPLTDPVPREIVVSKSRGGPLSIMQYSQPVRGYFSYTDLMKHLHFTDSELGWHRDTRPYVTSYYNLDWGFCLNEWERAKLDPDARYSVWIDAEFKPGSLTYAELVIPGSTKQEILFSTYCCHPAMCSDGLSGPVVWNTLAHWINQLKQDASEANFWNPKYTYRFFIGPETIGPIIYMNDFRFFIGADVAKKEDFPIPDRSASKIKAGWVMTCLGGGENYYTLQNSRAGNTYADRISRHALYGTPSTYSPWRDRSSDERQYCWPGIDLPVCSVRRQEPNRYREYHTSADNLKYVTAESLQQSLYIYKRIVMLLESDHRYQATTLCEPHMSKRALYPTVSKAGSSGAVRSRMNVLSMCDGRSVLDIAEFLGMPAFYVIDLLDELEKHELVRRI